mgnify:CR=1 FL=1
MNTAEYENAVADYEFWACLVIRIEYARCMSEGGLCGEIVISEISKQLLNLKRAVQVNVSRVCASRPVDAAANI